jgi:hypothetical protein
MTRELPLHLSIALKHEALPVTVHLPLLESGCWSGVDENGLSAQEKRLPSLWPGGPYGEKKLAKTCCVGPDIRDLLCSS